PVEVFHSHHYLRHNQRRQEHLATLGLDLARKTVLEVGAGIGDHSSFFLDRGCTMTITEARLQNLSYIQKRYPAATVRQLDLNDPPANLGGTFEIVYCYGTLYHLEKPETALKFMSSLCTGMLLLETCVSFTDTGTINLWSENPLDPSQSILSQGCRPARSWIFETLKKLFPYVYMPLTQPWHEEFPLDWTAVAPSPSSHSRAVFIASREKLDCASLTDNIPMKQRRC
ncbi:MAG TPA: methyltransferase domain-containing protein, partial [Opitutaceae bacterium]|nr:methyltransferase domain-containing protein [Opitutaceae bacterium]